MGTVWRLAWHPVSEAPEVRQNFSKSLDLILHKEAANQVKFFAERLKETGCKVKWKLTTRINGGQEEFCPQMTHFTVRKIDHNRIPYSIKELYVHIASVVHSTPKLSLEAEGSCYLKWVKFYDNSLTQPNAVSVYLIS